MLYAATALRVQQSPGEMPGFYGNCLQQRLAMKSSVWCVERGDVLVRRSMIRVASRRRREEMGHT
jgi:hypothetical protein